MGGVHCFTSVSFSYLGRARVLAETVRKVHPDWTLWLCISDREPEGFAFDPAAEAFDRVIWAHELPITNIEQWIFKHNVVELCTAVKGFVLNRILADGAEKVVYLDPDIAVLNDLSPVIAGLEDASIMLTPHLVDPETTETAIDDNERSALLHGVYNLGFVAVRNSPEGKRFADWWQDRLERLCYEEASAGIYTDQRWCDLVPAFFDGVRVLRDPGFNVASWNLSRRSIRVDENGRLLVNQSPLRFYHFTKINSVGEGMVTRYGAGSITVFELVKWYRERLERHEPEGLPHRWWHYDKYSDGSTIAYSERVLYRRRKDLMRKFPTLFNADTYLSWLKSAEGVEALEDQS